MPAGGKGTAAAWRHQWCLQPEATAVASHNQRRAWRGPARMIHRSIQAAQAGLAGARLSPAPPPERSSLSQLLARRVHSTAMFNRVHCCQQRPPVPATSPLAARILSQLDQLPKAPGWDDKPYCPPGAFGTCLGNCINPGARDWKGGHASQPAWSGGLQGTFEASVCVQRAGCAQAGVPGIVPAGLAASRGSQARPHPVYENSGLHACCCYNMDCKTSQASKRPAAWRLQQAGGRLSWGGIADPCSYY